MDFLTIFYKALLPAISDCQYVQIMWRGSHMAYITAIQPYIPFSFIGNHSRF